MSDDIIRHRDNTPEFEENYERAFGDSKPAKGGSWVWDSKLGKLVEKTAPQAPRPDAPTVLTMEEFVSPIDGSVISDHGQLRDHNARNGVTNIQDYGDNNGADYFARSAEQRDRETRGATHEAKMERRHELRQRLRRSGY